MHKPTNNLPAVALLLDSARGVYIPRDFITGFDMTLWQGISEENASILADAEHAHYWEAWDEVMQRATFTDNGNVWRLQQDGDLWAICYELMTEEEKDNFGMNDD